jgi:hypothetical protein
MIAVPSLQVPRETPPCKILPSGLRRRGNNAPAYAKVFNSLRSTGENTGKRSENSRGWFAELEQAIAAPRWQNKKGGPRCNRARPMMIQALLTFGDCVGILAQKVESGRLFRR